MAPHRLLGLDPGLRKMGWGLITAEGNRLGHVANGVIAVDPDQTLALRLADIYRALEDLIDELRPTGAAVEQTFVNKDAAATLKLGQARGVALLVPALHGLDVAEYAPNVVKKSVVGVGHAAKEQIHHMVRHLLPRCEIKGADAADALAVAICHAHHMQNRFSKRGVVAQQKAAL